MTNRDERRTPRMTPREALDYLEWVAVMLRTPEGRAVLAGLVDVPAVERM
jgi:hypothetical protein